MMMITVGLHHVIIIHTIKLDLFDENPFKLNSLVKSKYPQYYDRKEVL